MGVNTALVTDFDGTVSDSDFFWFIAERYFDEEMLAPWREYLAGKITHFNALNEMFGQIRLPENELLKCISEIKIDAWFIPTMQLCFEKNIPVYICSAGCDYYIEASVGATIKKYNITLVTNHGVYSRKEGLKMLPPSPESPYYDPDVGISKVSIVNKLRLEGYRVIFAGDGPPDFAAAEAANVVFAKKILLKKCIAANIKTQKFGDYGDIFNFIKGAQYELPVYK